MRDERERTNGWHNGRAHHGPDGRFRLPWTVPGRSRGLTAFLRWQIDRIRSGGGPPRPPDGALPIAPAEPARPSAGRSELRVTWIGHATFLLQIGGRNLLTDPVWSERASPVSWLGPRRIVPAALDFTALPPLDGVLLSHDHYDHLDRPTVLRIVRTFGAGLPWITPLGYADWLRGCGARTIVETDWGETAEIDGVRLTALPAQHWTQREPGSRNRRLWCSWRIEAAPGARMYFGGDSGWFDGYRRLGREHGPFDVTFLPIGAYAPRWFMRPFHMNPEEAVDAWVALGAKGLLMPMHWGTFVLSDEPVLEPPDRLSREWRRRDLPAELLRIPRHGETVVVPAPAGTAR